MVGTGQRLILFFGICVVLPEHSLLAYTLSVIINKYSDCNHPEFILYQSGLTVLRRYFFCGSFVLLICLVFVIVSRLFIAVLWPNEGKGLISLLLFVMFTFPFGILGQVWYLFVSIPDPWGLSYFEYNAR